MPTQTNQQATDTTANTANNNSAQSQSWGAGYGMGNTGNAGMYGYGAGMGMNANMNAYQMGMGANQAFMPINPYFANVAQPNNPYFNTTANTTQSGILATLTAQKSEILKGALIGAAATFILTNPTTQSAIFKGIAKLSSLLEMGVEELKERYEDAKAEVNEI